MKKNIPIILFFIFVLITTFITAYFAEAEKVISFMEDQKELYISDYNLLTQKTIIANYRDKTDSYVLKEPLFSISLQDNLKTFDFTIKSYASFKKDNFNSGLVFIMTNVHIDDVNTLLDDHNEPILDVKITYSSNLFVNEKEFPFSTETFVPVFDTKIGFFLIDYENLKDINNDYVEISSLEFFYRTSAETISLLKVETNDLSLENVLLHESYHSNYVNNEKIYYNETLLKHYKSFNSYYFKYLLIEAIILVVIAYFSFFHKDVVKKYHLKKFKQKTAYEALKAQKEKEENL